MITYTTNTIFTSDAQTLVVPVNTVGVMGTGLAKDFKDRHPDMYRRYRRLCKKGLFDVGKLWLYNIPGSSNSILAFPTKRHWRRNSSLLIVEAGLRKFVEHYDNMGIESIAFPMLGTGKGNLSWDDVKPLMESYLNDLPIDIRVHEYGIVKPGPMVEAKPKPTAGMALEVINS